MQGTLGLKLTLLRTGRYRSRNFLRDQFQCAIAGRPREDNSHRRTDRVFDPALSVDSQPAAPRPYVTLTCLRGFGRLAGGGCSLGRTPLQFPGLPGRSTRARLSGFVRLLRHSTRARPAINRTMF